MTIQDKGNKKIIWQFIKIFVDITTVVEVYFMSIIMFCNGLIWDVFMKGQVI